MQIKDVKFLSLKKYSDERGFFKELFRIPDLDVSKTIKQISHSEVFPGVLKAWHGHQYQYQWTYILKGTVLMTLVDIREDSETFGLNFNSIIGNNAEYQMYGFPPGVMHGYKNVGGKAEILYFTSGVYDPKEEIRYDPYDKKIPFDWSKTCIPR